MTSKFAYGLIFYFLFFFVCSLLLLVSKKKCSQQPVPLVNEKDIKVDFFLRPAAQSFLLLLRCCYSASAGTFHTHSTQHTAHSTQCCFQLSCPAKKSYWRRYLLFYDVLQYSLLITIDTVDLIDFPFSIDFSFCLSIP